MLAVGLDDTDSRETGMCTTYVGALLGERLRRAGFDVGRHLLVRCNPAVEHKTRGNAAVAVHVDAGEREGDGRPENHTTLPEADVERIVEIAGDLVDEFAATDDEQTNPGLVVAPTLGAAPASIPSRLRAFSIEAVRGHHEIEDAVELATQLGYRTAAWGNGRGRIGALAAVGAWGAADAWSTGQRAERVDGIVDDTGERSHDGADEPNRDASIGADRRRLDGAGDWTFERIVYRDPARWGTERSVDAESVFEAADEHYPLVWDTVDRTAAEVVCVPHTPGPVLFGIRGDEAGAVEAVADAIEAEPIDRAVTFVTNQGTDAHVLPRSDAEGACDDVQAPLELSNGRSYRVDGVVDGEPETRAGGHVFVDVGPPERCADLDAVLECVAFEPTKRFRDRVRSLRPGDDVTVCGELADGTLKLEKFALRDPVRTETVTPACPDCDRRMESAGADQGYRCRDCNTSAPGLAERALDRALDVGWYEVPPIARRHVAKPLVRGGFDGPTHPER